MRQKDPDQETNDCKQQIQKFGQLSWCQIFSNQRSIIPRNCDCQLVSFPLLLIGGEVEPKEKINDNEND
jgi:hypothetical protein